MNKLYLKLIFVMMLEIVIFDASIAFAWHDKTHIAIAKAAGYDSWYNAAGPDITKTKAGDKEATNHWFNNTAGVEITSKMVLDQAIRYNDPGDTEGHLYGAIIASFRDYKSKINAGKYEEYTMAFCAHYIGDLSMPLHNSPYNAFNQKHHAKNDGTIEFSVMNNIGFIQKNMYEIQIKSEEDLAREIARIANLSRQLAIKLEKEDRDMTSEEAYAQISHSASLLRAVLLYAGAKN